MLLLDAPAGWLWHPALRAQLLTGREEPALIVQASTGTSGWSEGLRSAEWQRARDHVLTTNWGADLQRDTSSPLAAAITSASTLLSRVKAADSADKTT